MFWMPRRALWLAIATTIASAGAAQESVPTAPDPGPDRPSLTLVLSGGGARGAAQVGVLRVLEELRVPVDMVVGTSTGAIIGGLYATGWSPDEIEELILAVDWDRIFSDRVDRTEKSFRRKQDDHPFLIQTRMRFKGWKPYLPPGMLGGQRLELLLRSIEFRSTAETDFDRFPIPFRAVATDLVTGEVRVIGSGSLAAAMRASMAVPGVFSPVDLGGRLLVDGGAVANLPVGVAQALGAGQIVAVDISSPLDATKKELGSVFGVVSQLTNFLTVGNSAEDVKRLRPGDVLITPDLGDLSYADFKRAREAMSTGEAAARAVAERLRQFSVSEVEYAAFQVRKHRRSADDLVIDEVVMENTSRVATEVVRQELHVPLGRPVDDGSLEHDLLALYGLDFFGLVTDRLERRDNRTRLVVATPPMPQGRASLQFGLSVADDFSGGTTYGALIRHHVLPLNRRGGEWQNVLQLGSTVGLASELYQPLDYGLHWFVAPSVELRRRTQSTWSQGHEVGEYRFKTAHGRLDLGRVLGSWGEVRLCAFAADDSGETRIGLSPFPDTDAHLFGGVLQLRVDTLDSAVFPRHGTNLVASYTHGLEALGSNVAHRQVALDFDQAWTFGKSILRPGVEVGVNLEDEANVFSLYSLGGLLRLSGLEQNELWGQRFGLARIVCYRQLARTSVASLKANVYAGGSLEAGNVFADDDPVVWDTLKTAGSLFIGLDTSIGPFLLSWGFAEGGRQVVSVSIGEQF